MVSKSQEFLIWIQTESDKPYLTIFDIELLDYCGFVLCQFVCDPIIVQSSRLPTDYFIFTRFGQDEVTEPSATVHIVPVNVSGGKVWKMTQFCGERLLGFVGIMTVGQLNGILQLLGVKPPDLQTVIHSTGDDLGSRRVEVRTEHLVSVTLNTTKYGDVVLGLDVPQPQGVVLGDCQEEVGVPGVELDLVDGVAVADKVSDAGHGRWAEQADDAPRSCGGQQRFVGV